MPWASAIGGLLQTWYSGNEAGNAIADVLYGNVNPCGRLPLTLPVREEDIPAHLNDKSENGKIQYIRRALICLPVTLILTLVVIARTSSLVISITKQEMSSPSFLSGDILWLSSQHIWLTSPAGLACRTPHSPSPTYP
jgi:hypothetical protein